MKMPFCWFSRKFKSSYNLNHEYDQNFKLHNESRSVFSENVKKPNFSEVNHEEKGTTITEQNTLQTSIRADSSQNRENTEADDYYSTNPSISTDNRHHKIDDDMETKQLNDAEDLLKISEKIQSDDQERQNDARDLLQISENIQAEDQHHKDNFKKDNANENIYEQTLSTEKVIGFNNQKQEIPIETNKVDESVNRNLENEHQDGSTKENIKETSVAYSAKESGIFSNSSGFRSSSNSYILSSEVENDSEIYSDPSERLSTDSVLSDTTRNESNQITKRRSGVLPKPVPFDEEVAKSLVKYPKTDSEKQFIKNAITKNEFLSKVITGRRLGDVVDAMYKKEIRAKEKIIKEGQTGTHMYVAAEGEFEVLKKGKGLVNVIKPGEVFGELAILYNAKRLATVKSFTSAKVWVIDGVVYQQLMKKSNIEEQDEVVSFLQNVPILNEVGVEVLRKVARLLKPEFFETGTVIVQEGDEGEKFYIITAGSVTVSQEDEGFIGQLHKGQCFGEKAILETIARQATVTAVAPGTECLTLTQEHFINHFGKVKDISNLTITLQSQIIIEDDEVNNEYSHLDLSEFKILKTLGVGGFGRVEFVQHKTDPSLTFALKYLKKYEMVQQDQQHHVINEKQIQMSCKTSFIIRMYKTFKDNKYIYFLMEVCLGGDLWSLLQKQPNKKFEEKGARFIAACVLEALSYLHERGIVYRDLKPENLLIDNYGYIKMTDFGFAKRLPQNSKSGTFAGTPEYVAPEIILNRGHDKAVDYWAYGIFIYELLNGRTPFRSSDPSYMRTYNNILTGLEGVIFPSHVGSKAKNLISKLLKKSPEERLGCLRGGVGDIRSHVWFNGFDWESLRKGEIPSPYKPRLSSNVDTRHIETFSRDYDIPPDETSGWDEFF